MSSLHLASICSWLSVPNGGTDVVFEGAGAEVEGAIGAFSVELRGLGTPFEPEEC